MKAIDVTTKPTKEEQITAVKSYSALHDALKLLKANEAEIEIEETKKVISIPVKALRLLEEILKAMSEGKPISVVPMATEVTTQKAAEILGCSRPHLVKLLEEGEIPFTKVGRHRRLVFQDVIQYKQKMKAAQKKHIIDIMDFDEELGLYDS